MRLYHGSNIEIREPELINNGRALDFGVAFYLTSSFEQAERWSKAKTKRRKTGEATVSVFELEQEMISMLKVMRFESANAEWLKFISANRNNQYLPEKWDLIIGPVANDNTLPVVNLYLKGSYDEGEALKRLLTQKLKDQYAFKTKKAISMLKFCEVIKV